jgi:hypothetical protein
MVCVPISPRSLPSPFTRLLSLSPGTWDSRPSRSRRQRRAELHSRFTQQQRWLQQRDMDLQRSPSPVLAPPPPPSPVLPPPPAFDVNDPEDVFDYVQRVPPPQRAPRVAPAAASTAASVASNFGVTVRTPSRPVQVSPLILSSNSSLVRSLMPVARLIACIQSNRSGRRIC